MTFARHILLRLAIALVAAIPSIASAQLFTQLGSAKWRDDTGRTVSLGDLAGQPMIVTMSYTACRKTCSSTMLLLKEMQAILDREGKKATFVVITYDPEHDSPAEWTRYRRLRELPFANWHFLTGSQADTKRASVMLDLDYWWYHEHVMHDFRVVLFDRHGRWKKQIDGDRVGDLPAALASLD